MKMTIYSNTCAMHLYNIVIFIHDIFFSVHVTWEAFLLYITGGDTLGLAISISHSLP